MHKTAPANPTCPSNSLIGRRRLAAFAAFLFLAASPFDARGADIEGQPDLGVWKPGPNMGSERSDHSATLLGGPACQVKPPPPFCGKVLVAGGTVNTHQGLAAAELYDPVSLKWTPVAPMKQPRFLHSAVALESGDVLVVEGLESVGVPARSEIYDPVRNSWRATKDPPLKHSGFKWTATLLTGRGCGNNCGKVLLAGGFVAGGGAVQNSAQLFDPKSETWTRTPPMVRPRTGHTAILLTGPGCGAHCGKVLVAGGDEVPRDPASYLTAEFFDPIKKVWVPTAKLVHPSRGGDMVALTDGTALLAGGSAVSRRHDDPDPYSPSRMSQVFDPGVGRWRGTGGLNFRRAEGVSTIAGVNDHFLTALSDGTALAAGGNMGNVEPGAIAAELFHPDEPAPEPAQRGAWKVAARMSGGRLGQAATLLQCEGKTARVLVTGGRKFEPPGINGFGFLNSAEIYSKPVGVCPALSLKAGESSGMQHSRPPSASRWWILGGLAGLFLAAVAASGVLRRRPEAPGADRPG